MGKSKLFGISIPNFHYTRNKNCVSNKINTIREKRFQQTHSRHDIGWIIILLSISYLSYNSDHKSSDRGSFFISSERSSSYLCLSCSYRFFDPRKEPYSPSSTSGTVEMRGFSFGSFSFLVGESSSERVFSDTLASVNGYSSFKYCDYFAYFCFLSFIKAQKATIAVIDPKRIIPEANTT